jgi:hypothetical protein
MGHWSERVVEEAAALIGAKVDRDALREVAQTVASEIEMLAGRRFGVSEQRTVTFNSGGLLFIDVPDLQVTGGLTRDTAPWPVADPVNSHIATVLQIARPDVLDVRAIPTGEALWTAGQLVANASRDGLLSGEFLLSWLRDTFDAEQRVEFLRRLVDPTNRIHVPIVAAQGGGWWFQIARRLLWVTNTTPEQRLLEPLIDMDGGVRALVGVEPILIVARMTSHPVEFAFSARIWPSVTLPSRRRWPVMARAIHRHGIPIMTIDEASSPEETACQLLLLGYWHGYIGGAEPGLADAVAHAYPKPVKRICRATHEQDIRSGAALLLERLLHPGFDPARGAEATRRYVAVQAGVVVANHRKSEASVSRPHEWQRLGVSERYYYKLLKRFAPRFGRRYVVGDEVRARVTEYLRGREMTTTARQLNMEVLEGRGFGPQAARKWLQRHHPQEVVNARPRGSRRTPTARP